MVHDHNSGGSGNADFVSTHLSLSRLSRCLTNMGSLKLLSKFLPSEHQEVHVFQIPIAIASGKPTVYYGKLHKNAKSFDDFPNLKMLIVNLFNVYQRLNE